MLTKNPRTLMLLGMACVSGAILLGRFAAGFPISDFLQGMLIGTSLCFLPVSLFRWRAQRAK